MPAGSPPPGDEWRTIRCENSEVLPSGSVAVALTLSPGSRVTGRTTLIGAFPLPLVVTWSEPRYVLPSTYDRGQCRHDGFE